LIYPNKMKKQFRRSLWALLMLQQLTTIAQDLMFQKVIQKHKVSTKIIAPTAEELKESGVMLQNDIYIEYAFDSLDQFNAYEGNIRRIHLNDSKSIELYNKLILPVPTTQDLLYLRARSISKNGTIKEVGVEAVKDLEEQGRVFKIVAIEGLEVGGELEYTVLFKRNNSTFGREILQADVPIREAKLMLTSPSHLIFEVKVYNEVAKISADSAQGKRTIEAIVKDIKPVFEEKYAHLRANLVRADFKLSYNTTQGADRLYDWQQAAQTFYDFLETGREESSKDILAFLTKQKIKGLPQEAAIRAIENYVKTNISFKESEDTEAAADVLKNQYGNKAGIVRFYVCALKALKIPHEIVISCPRSSAIFDKNFESWNYLDEYLLYFPTSKKFIDPVSPVYRYGMIDQLMEGNQGLFIQSKKEGNDELIVGDVRLIPYMPMESSYDNQTADVSFKPTMDQIQGTFVRTMNGHVASQLRPFFFLSKSEKDIARVKEEVIKSMLKPDVQILNTTLKNTNLNNDEVNKPFIISSDVSLQSVVEKAGKKVLFKIGELIGPQVEMYNERPRAYDIDMYNAHSYHRVIRLKIPAGYKISSGLTELKRSITDGNAKPEMGFISNYKLDKGVLTVTVDEFYKNVLLPKNIYDTFQKVINAAADFNKATLVIEKQ
jgi:Domain of Unknown Function with PDB structure (DUF3857)/Transglutaminase-like superfamily